MSHPAGLPDLFLDRSLGRLQVPDLLRAAGLRVVTLADHYGIPQDEAIPGVVRSEPSPGTTGRAGQLSGWLSGFDGLPMPASLPCG